MPQKRILLSLGVLMTSTTSNIALGRSPDFVEIPDAQPDSGIYETAADIPDYASQAKGDLLIPVTPFANMASGYQATNEGFRAILKDRSGRIIAAGHMGIEAAMRGYSEPASAGTAYGRLVLNVPLTWMAPELETGRMDGPGQGTLSICMAADKNAPLESSSCKSLSGNLHPERPFQWIEKGVSYRASAGKVNIERYSGQTGEGGTSTQIALAVFHPAYNFAAPAKAFKDYQSPLVIDLNGNRQIDLLSVHDRRHKVLFDLTGDGRVARTGWVAAGDALLALDANGNGMIDSGRELFGQHSKAAGPVAIGREDGLFENGFLALGLYDSNLDGKIDAKDPVFSKLLVWRDRNSDGKSQRAELTGLADAGVASISLAWKPAASTEHASENEIRETSFVTMKSGARRQIVDVWFKQQAIHSLAAN